MRSSYCARGARRMCPRSSKPSATRSFSDSPLGATHGGRRARLSRRPRAGAAPRRADRVRVGRATRRQRCARRRLAEQRRPGAGAGGDRLLAGATRARARRRHPRCPAHLLLGIQGPTRRPPGSDLRPGQPCVAARLPSGAGSPVRASCARISRSRARGATPSSSACCLASCDRSSFAAPVALRASPRSPDADPTASTRTDAAQSPAPAGATSRSARSSARSSSSST
jgi:hypothetical protein